MPTFFKLVKHACDVEFETTVNTLLADGWQLHGITSRHHPHWVQSMIYEAGPLPELSEKVTETESIFLSQAEVELLTGYKTISKKLSFLQDKQIEHLLNGSSEIVISRAYIQRVLGCDQNIHSDIGAVFRPFDVLDSGIDFDAINGPKDFRSLDQWLANKLSHLNYKTKSQLKKDFDAGRFHDMDGVGAKTIKAVGEFLG